MVQWLLLDRIDAEARGTAVGRQDDLVVVAGSHETKAALPFAQLAEPRAEITLDAAVLEVMPIPARTSTRRSGCYGGSRLVHCPQLEGRSTEIKTDRQNRQKTMAR
jgi:hypothetical protein